MNHDGSLSDQPGVNERFGIGLVDRYQLFFFVKPNEAAFIRDPTEHAFDMAMGAHTWLENILWRTSAPTGPHELRRRILRPLLRPGRSRADSPVLRRRHRRRLLLDDRLDQRRPPAACLRSRIRFTHDATHAPSAPSSTTLPKAELHLHLEGSIRPETAVELAARHGTKLTAEEVIARYNYADFAGFIDIFKWVTSFLRDPADYALITRKLLEELLRQNVVYAEITISTGVMLRRMQNVEANFAAIRETSQSVSFSRLRTAWIFDAARQFGADAANGSRALGRANSINPASIAFGMGGDELAFPAVNFRAAFDLARARACTSSATPAKLAVRKPSAKPSKFSAPNASATASP